MARCTCGQCRREATPPYRSCAVCLESRRQWQARKRATKPHCQCGAPLPRRMTQCHDCRKRIVNDGLLCAKCHKVPPDSGFRQCGPCRQRALAWQNNWQAKNKRPKPPKPARKPKPTREGYSTWTKEARQKWDAAREGVEDFCARLMQARDQSRKVGQR